MLDCRLLDLDIGHWFQGIEHLWELRMQASKEEMIDALYKPLENESDDGIIRLE